MIGAPKSVKWAGFDTLDGEDQSFCTMLHVVIWGRPRMLIGGPASLSYGDHTAITAEVLDRHYILWYMRTGHPRV